MSLQDVRVKLEAGLNDIYTALEEKEATIPEQKNLTNVGPAIRSITGGGANQVVNYTMLYDGSLGSAGENGANVCSEVTGGYVANPKDVDDYEKSDVIFSDNYIELNAVRNNINKMSSFGTNNLLNLSSYKKVANIISGYSSSSSSTSVFNSFYFSSERGYVASANRKSPLFSNYMNTNKTLYSLDIDIEENYYFSGFHSMVTKGNSYLRLHNAFLVKQDNFQPILDLAGITTAYTDEASICADSTAMETILNNEEAVNYMLLNCTGTFMLAFIQSSTALTALASSPYVKNVHLNAHWLKFLNFLR